MEAKKTTEDVVIAKTMKEQKTMGLPVKQAFLHQALMWPGVCGSEKTMSKINGVKMSYAPGGLILKAKGQTCIVPLANVVSAILSDE